ncbi:MAG: hypothetical protein EA364_10805 [Balneolaceae bacterium]|nr:MAG: hypothetical protein EA364_10805 [Balneolaceae bacterium]
MKKTIVLFTIPLLMLVFVSCSGNESHIPEDQILARVGDHVITAREFQLNYEFGFPHLMQGENRKEEYLHRMIAELLIAQRGYELQIDTLSSIRNAVQTMREERVIEEVFNHFVLSNIEISRKEIEYEVNKTAVSVQFRYLPAANRTHAERLRQQLLEDSFETVAAQFVTDVFDATNDQIAERFTSRVTKAVDVNPELISHLQDLELHTPSEPIQYQDQWYIFMVHNIIRTPLSPYDIANRSVSARKVLYNTKAMQMAAEFVNETMTPFNVETNRSTFERIVPHLFELYEQGTPAGTLWNRISEGRRTESYYRELYAVRSEPLVYTSIGTWSVERFFRTFNTGRYQLRPDTPESFTLRFSDVIALVVRDVVLLEKARAERLEESFDVQRDIRRWQDKWVFQETRNRILDTLAFNNDVVMQFVNSESSPYPEQIRGRSFNDYQEGSIHRFRRDFLAQALMNAAEEFKQIHKVTINYAMLDTITVSQSSANPNMSLQVFNQNSNRMAYPVLDPIW